LVAEAPRSASRLRFDCGTDDALIEDNRNLHHAFESVSIAHTYEEFPGGHDWSYWQTHVERTLEFVAFHNG
jgi:putative tributyrin esterase